MYGLLYGYNSHVNLIKIIQGIWSEILITYTVEKVMSKKIKLRRKVKKYSDRLQLQQLKKNFSYKTKINKGKI